MDYGSRAINKVLGLSNLASCAYKVNIFRQAHEIEVEFTEVIATPGLVWSRSKGKALHLKEGRLTETTQGVHKFMCSQLMPTGHQSDVT